MSKFLCTHSVGAGKVTPQQMEGFAKAGQADPKVKGYRSFANLTEGKVVCIMEAPSKGDVTDWFKKMNMPVDSIVELEFEGDRGTVRAA